MSRRKKIIMVPHGNVQKMMKAYGYTRSAVYNALAFRTDSETAKLIRNQAIQLYGGVTTTKIIFE